MQNEIKFPRLISLLDEVSNLQEIIKKVDAYTKHQSKIIGIVIGNESQNVLHVTKPAIDFSGFRSAISKFTSSYDFLKLIQSQDLFPFISFQNRYWKSLKMAEEAIHLIGRIQIRVQNTSGHSFCCDVENFIGYFKSQSISIYLLEIQDIDIPYTGDAMLFWIKEKSILSTENLNNAVDLRTICPLSKRELEVLQLSSKGKTSIQIGKELFISSHTVSEHKKKILKKTQTNKLTAAITKAKTEGWLL
jgi:DNA-binding CsgD family transcriptional regulator